MADFSKLNSSIATLSSDVDDYVSAVGAVVAAPVADQNVIDAAQGAVDQVDQKVKAAKASLPPV